MIQTYEDYLPLPSALTFGEMASLHKEIAEEIHNDSDAIELYRDLLAASVRYLESRANWPLWDREQRIEKDAARTSRHNLVIIAFNQLARYLQMQGRAAAWRDMLGDEKDCRKRIGDFACYIAFAESLNAR